MVEELKNKKLLKLDNGAQIVDLEAFGMPPCIVVKSNGSSVYVTRDLAAAKYRQAHYNAFKECLYVVDAGQSLHFKQLFKVLELAGHTWASKLKHIPLVLSPLKE